MLKSTLVIGAYDVQQAKTVGCWILISKHSNSSVSFLKIMLQWVS